MYRILEILKFIQTHLFHKKNILLIDLEGELFVTKKDSKQNGRKSIFGLEFKPENPRCSNRKS